MIKVHLKKSKRDHFDRGVDDIVGHMDSPICLCWPYAPILLTVKTAQACFSITASVPHHEGMVCPADPSVPDLARIPSKQLRRAQFPCQQC